MNALSILITDWNIRYSPIDQWFVALIRWQLIYIELYIEALFWLTFMFGDKPFDMTKVSGIE